MSFSSILSNFICLGLYVAFDLINIIGLMHALLDELTLWLVKCLLFVEISQSKLIFTASLGLKSLKCRKLIISNVALITVLYELYMAQIMAFWYYL